MEDLPKIKLASEEIEKDLRSKSKALVPARAFSSSANINATPFTFEDTLFSQVLTDVYNQTGNPYDLYSELLKRDPKILESNFNANSYNNLHPFKVLGNTAVTFVYDALYSAVGIPVFVGASLLTALQEGYKKGAIKKEITYENGEFKTVAAKSPPLYDFVMATAKWMDSRKQSIHELFPVAPEDYQAFDTDSLGWYANQLAQMGSSAGLWAGSYAYAQLAKKAITSLLPKAVTATKVNPVVSVIGQVVGYALMQRLGENGMEMAAVMNNASKEIDEIFKNNFYNPDGTFNEKSFNEYRKTLDSVFAESSPNEIKENIILRSAYANNTLNAGNFMWDVIQTAVTMGTFRIGSVAFKGLGKYSYGAMPTKAFKANLQKLGAEYTIKKGLLNNLTRAAYLVPGALTEVPEEILNTIAEKEALRYGKSLAQGAKIKDETSYLPTAARLKEYMRDPMVWEAGFSGFLGGLFMPVGMSAAQQAMTGKSVSDRLIQMMEAREATLTEYSSKLQNLQNNLDVDGSPLDKVFEEYGITEQEDKEKYVENKKKALLNEYVTKLATSASFSNTFNLLKKFTESEGFANLATELELTQEEQTEFVKRLDRVYDKFNKVRRDLKKYSEVELQHYGNIVLSKALDYTLKQEDNAELEKVVNKEIATLLEQSEYFNNLNEEEKGLFKIAAEKQIYEAFLRDIDVLKNDLSHIHAYKSEDEIFTNTLDKFKEIYTNKLEELNNTITQSTPETKAKLDHFKRSTTYKSLVDSLIEKEQATYNQELYSKFYNNLVTNQDILNDIKSQFNEVLESESDSYVTKYNGMIAAIDPNKDIAQQIKDIEDSIRKDLTEKPALLESVLRKLNLANVKKRLNKAKRQTTESSAVEEDLPDIEPTITTEEAIPTEEELENEEEVEEPPLVTSERMEEELDSAKAEQDKTEKDAIDLEIDNFIKSATHLIPIDLEDIIKDLLKGFGGINPTSLEYIQNYIKAKKSSKNDPHNSIITILEYLVEDIKKYISKSNENTQLEEDSTEDLNNESAQDGVADSLDNSIDFKGVSIFLAPLQGLEVFETTDGRIVITDPKIARSYAATMNAKPGQKVKVRSANVADFRSREEAKEYMKAQGADNAPIVITDQDDTVIGFLQTTEYLKREQDVVYGALNLTDTELSLLVNYYAGKIGKDDTNNRNKVKQIITKIYKGHEDFIKTKDQFKDAVVHIGNLIRYDNKSITLESLRDSLDRWRLKIFKDLKNTMDIREVIFPGNGSTAIITTVINEVSSGALALASPTSPNRIGTLKERFGEVTFKIGKRNKNTTKVVEIVGTGATKQNVRGFKKNIYLVYESSLGSYLLSPVMTSVASNGDYGKVLNTFMQGKLLEALNDFKLQLSSNIKPTINKELANFIRKYLIGIEFNTPIYNQQKGKYVDGNIVITTNTGKYTIYANNTNKGPALLVYEFDEQKGKNVTSRKSIEEVLSETKRAASFEGINNHNKPFTDIITNKTYKNYQEFLFDTDAFSTDATGVYTTDDSGNKILLGFELAFSNNTTSFNKVISLRAFNKEDFADTQPTEEEAEQDLSFNGQLENFEKSEYGFLIQEVKKYKIAIHPDYVNPLDIPAVKNFASTNSNIKIEAIKGIYIDGTVYFTHKLKSHSNPTATIAHEFIHGLLDKGLSAIEKEKLYKELREYINQLVTVSESARILSDTEHMFNSDEKRIIRDFLNLIQQEGKEEEVITYAFSNPLIYQFLNFVEEGGEVVNNPNDQETFWKKLGNILKKYLQKVVPNANQFNKLLNILEGYDVTFANTQSNPPSNPVTTEPVQLNLFTNDPKLDALSDFAINVGLNKMSIDNISYTLKAVDILSSDKAKEIFNKGKKNNWSLDKILNELQIPKEQKELILNLDITDREQIIVELVTNYTYTIGIYPVKESLSDFDIANEVEDGVLLPTLFIPDTEWVIEEDEDGNVISAKEVISKKGEEQLKERESRRQFTDYHKDVSVPGGINYRENEIFAPLIEPYVQGHAYFSTKNGIGWFRSDDKDFIYEQGLEEITQETYQNLPKVRRILELQSQLFQEGRNKKGLTSKTVDAEFVNLPDNQFLQLLNKNNNWVTFFIKAVIQNSAKQNYKKVLFPTGDTTTKIQKYPTVEEVIAELEGKLALAEKLLNDSYDKSNIKRLDGYYSIEHDGFNYMAANTIEEIPQGIIEQYIEPTKKMLEDAKANKLNSSFVINFYENVIPAILKKQNYNPSLFTDEHGNTWNSVDIVQERDIKPILFDQLRDDSNKKPNNSFNKKWSKNQIEYFEGVPLVVVNKVKHLQGLGFLSKTINRLESGKLVISVPKLKVIGSDRMQDDNLSKVYDNYLVPDVKTIVKLKNLAKNNSNYRWLNVLEKKDTKGNSYHILEINKKEAEEYATRVANFDKLTKDIYKELFVAFKEQPALYKEMLEATRSFSTNNNIASELKTNKQGETFLRFTKNGEAVAVLYVSENGEINYTKTSLGLLFKDPKVTQKEKASVYVAASYKLNKQGVTLKLPYGNGIVYTEETSKFWHYLHDNGYVEKTTTHVVFDVTRPETKARKLFAKFLAIYYSNPSNRTSDQIEVNLEENHITEFKKYLNSIRFDDLDDSTSETVRKETEQEFVERVQKLNTTLDNYLKSLGFTSVFDSHFFNSKKPLSNSLAAVDILNKLVATPLNLESQAYSKEVAFVLLRLLGHKNLLRIELINSIKALPNYQELAFKYKDSKLGEYSISELIAVDLLQQALIDAHKEYLKNPEKFLPRNASIQSKDVTVSSKLDYALLKLKIKWHNILVKHAKDYKAKRVQDIIDAVASDVYNNKFDLYQTVEDLPTTPITLDSKLQHIQDVMLFLGAVSSGSYALSKQGTINRTSVNDLDFFVPYDIRGDFFKAVVTQFPEIVFKSSPFMGKSFFNAFTVMAELDGVKLDFFIPISKQADLEVQRVEIDGAKYAHYSNIFDAKLRIGSKKHLKDFMNFRPFVLPTTSISDKFDIRGQRHFNFDYTQSKYNSYIYNALDIIDTKEEEFSQEAEILGDYQEALAYFKDYEFERSNTYRILLDYYSFYMSEKQAQINATLSFYRLHSLNFEQFFGTRPSVPGKDPIFFRGNEWKRDVNSKPSILTSEDGMPIILYTGAGTSFDAFSKDYFFSGEGAMAYGAGFYTTTRKETAENYMRTSKSVEKSFKEFEEKDKEGFRLLMEELGEEAVKNYKSDKAAFIQAIMYGLQLNEYKTDVVDKLHKLGIIETKALYVNVSNPLYAHDPITDEQREMIEKNFNVTLEKNALGLETYRSLELKLNISAKALSAKLYQIGIDGMIHFPLGGRTVAGFRHQKGEMHVIFFEPHQAKHVSNSGLFDRNNVNMYDPMSVKFDQLDETVENAPSSLVDTLSVIDKSALQTAQDSIVASEFSYLLNTNSDNIAISVKDFLSIASTELSPLKEKILYDLLKSANAFFAESNQNLVSLNTTNAELKTILIDSVQYQNSNKRLVTKTNQLYTQLLNAGIIDMVDSETGKPCKI